MPSKVIPVLTPLYFVHGISGNSTVLSRYGIYFTTCLITILQLLTRSGVDSSSYPRAPENLLLTSSVVLHTTVYHLHRIDSPDLLEHTAQFGHRPVTWLVREGRGEEGGEGGRRAKSVVRPVNIKKMWGSLKFSIFLNCTTRCTYCGVKSILIVIHIYKQLCKGEITQFC